MNTAYNKHILRWGGLLVTLVSAAGVYAFSLHIREEGWLQVSRGLQFSRLLGWGGVAFLALLTAYSWIGGGERIFGMLEKLTAWLSRLRWLLLPVLFVLIAAFPFLMMGRFQLYIAQNWSRHAAFLWLALLATVVWQALWHKGWGESLLASALSMAVVFHLTTYFPHVTNYPFALWWSETSRYYMASTFFAQDIYGHDLPWAFRDLSRYLLQSVPFFISDAPIWVHRLWQVLLRFSTPYITAMILARKYQLKKSYLFWLFTAWAGLYFFQGPVFYNLIVIVMVVVWLEDSRNFWKTLLVVVATSFYAGFSRVNWVPMPGLMVAAYYFLHQPVKGKDFKSVARYLLIPAVWVVVGLVSGIGGQDYWATHSGNPPEIYYSTFDAYLLWDRLFPNPSYALGILPAVLLVTAPLIVFVLLALRNWKQNWHFIRVLALAVITGGLFAGGLLVSVKIGGGTNLHNMDGFLVILLLIAADLYFGRSVNEQNEPVQISMPLWLKAAVLVAPIIFVISFVGRNASTLDEQAALQDLAKIQMYVDQATADSGEVLFISQRHLITFGLIENVALVHDYEKVQLQDMTMSKNEAYIGRFAEDLAAQKYDLIFMDHLPSIWKNPETTSLAMENNVVLWELVPWFNCAYQEEDRLVNGSLDVLMPTEMTTCDTVEE